MFRLSFILILLLTLSSCNWFFGVKDLGSGYYTYPDNNSLLYTGGKTYNGSAYQVIPSKMLAYKNNKDFLITKCFNKRGDITFWIVEKTREDKKYLGYHEEDSLTLGYTVYSNILGPLDSSNFYRIKDSLEISLGF